MNENMKSLCFVGAALAIVAVAWFAKPSLPVTDPEDMRGERLFPKFDNPLAATSMEIVQFDEDTASPRMFNVAQVKGVWSIPSHENYPADAEDQLARAASGVMGLTILEVKSSDAGDHELCGVCDPDPNKRKGTTGVGTRVTMKDKGGRELMSLIVGKEVPGQPELRFVRKVDQPAVYVTKVDVNQLSAKFEDWIEKDLLKLNTWDVQQVEVRDYTVDELQGTILHRGEMFLEYDDAGDPKWKMVKDVRLQQAGDQADWVPQEMAPDEELDTSKLDDMKSALDDLKIVDVTRKPPGLSGDLKASKSFYENREARASLSQRGFYVVPVAADRYELFSNEGEIRVRMKDGVRYVLRFGEVAGSSSAGSSEKGKEGQEEGEKEGDSGSPGLNRFIFVMAEFDPDAIEKPELEVPPDEEKTGGEETGAAADNGEAPEKAAEGETPAAAAGNETTEENTADETPAVDPETETAPEKAADETAAAAAGTETAQERAADETDEEAPAAEKGQETAASQTPAEKTGEEPAEEKTGDDPAEEKTGEEPAEEKADDAEAEKTLDVEAERERIEKENKRKQDEYEEKIEKGKERVKELNDRFGDWYYIISDEVYQKIHLGRDQIVKKKEKKEDEDQADSDAGTGDAGRDQSDDSGAPPDQPSGVTPEETPDPLDEFEKLKEEGPSGSD